MPADVCPVDLTDGLARAGDDREFYRELLELFLEDARQRLARLEGALSARDLNEVASAAHSVKGAAANLAAGRVRDIAYAIETRGRAGDETGLAALAGDLAVEIERVAAFTRGFSA